LETSSVEISTMKRMLRSLAFGLAVVTVPASVRAADDAANGGKARYQKQEKRSRRRRRT